MTEPAKTASDRWLIALVLAVLLLSAGAIAFTIDRIQVSLLQQDAMATALRWNTTILEEMHEVDDVFHGRGLSEADRSVINLASQLGDLHAYAVFDDAARVIAASDPALVGQKKTSDYWDDKLLRGKSHVNVEYQTPSKAGSDRLVLAEAYVPVLRGGTVIGAFEIYLDMSRTAESYARIGRYASVASIALVALAGLIAIVLIRRTLRYRAERETLLREARRVAESANQAKSSFLATVSHEIRTPMNGVLGVTELLDRSELSSEQEEMVRLIRDSANSLMLVINDVLDLSKIEANRLDVIPEPFALGQLLEEVRGGLEPAANAKGLALEVLMPSALPAAVLGDRQRLRQILVNLIGNAIKFTQVGRVAIEVSTDRSLSGDWIEITVTDSGIGIPADRIDALFQPFTQADPSTTRLFGGTGLGLAICRQLADLMGGSITVTSTESIGSRFTLLLPLPATDESAIEDTVTSIKVTDLDLTILVAEDNPTNRWLIGRQLADLGCRATIVEDGEQALEALQTGRFDILLTDWHMPRRDGLALAHAVRESETAGAQRLPVLLLTASAMPDELSVCRAAGADEVLTKPVGLSHLADALARWSGRGENAAQKENRIDPAPPVTKTEAVLGAADGTQPVLDITQLAEMCGGDTDMIEQMIFMFRSRLDGQLSEIEVACAAGDLPGVRKHAHSVSGAAHSAGATQLGTLLKRIEHAAANEDDESTANLIAKLPGFIDQLDGAISARGKG